MNDVLQAIRDRRSIRDYYDESVSKEALDCLVAAALQAPSARNSQPYHFTFVTDADMLSEFSSDARGVYMSKEGAPAKLKESTYDVLQGAKLVCFIFATGNGPFVGVDCGIAVENMALAAHSLGLGSVILGMPRDVFLSENRDKWHKKLSAPEGSVFSIAIGIGRPRSSKEAHPIRDGLVTIIKYRRYI